MQIFEAFNFRHQTRFFDHEKIPSKEFIENILYKTHELVPSKQNLMPYAVKILGPEHTEIKMYMYELACEVEYPNLNLRNKYRLDKIKSYEHNNIPYNNRFAKGNSQLFAPYILLLIPRKPVENTKLAKTYKKRGLAYADGIRLKKNLSNVEIGMFSVILSYVAIEEGLSTSYTSCLNSSKLIEKYEWLKKELNSPTLALSLGYKRSNVNSDNHLKRINRNLISGLKKPEKKQTFEWI